MKKFGLEFFKMALYEFRTTRIRLGARAHNQKTVRYLLITRTQNFNSNFFFFPGSLESKASVQIKTKIIHSHSHLSREEGNLEDLCGFFRVRVHAPRFDASKRAEKSSWCKSVDPASFNHTISLNNNHLHLSATASETRASQPYCTSPQPSQPTTYTY